MADTAAGLHQLSAAPSTSLNALPGSSRRIRVAHLSLADARAVAHAHGALEIVLPNAPRPAEAKPKKIAVKMPVTAKN
jgi:hypothetical protein